jgi:hypothetical protein
MKSTRGCSVGITDNEGFMTYAIKVASGAMIYISDFMTIGSGIQAILRLLPQQFGTLQY